MPGAQPGAACVRLLLLSAMVAARVHTCHGESTAETLRSIVRSATAPDPLRVEALINGTDNVPVTVAGLGQAIGIRTERVDKYLGLPYALPPLGQRRWAPPEPVTAWAPSDDADCDSTHSCKVDRSAEGGQPLNATVFGPACPSALTGGTWIRAEEESEDCLYLNVWVPRGHVEAHAAGRVPALPVIVYIHGGGFIMGSGRYGRAPPP
jgi:para-nitrobenzyl esterase